ncbi:hypothetical protein JIQ42_05007 [Leishmania sp. Namibia]|uniref:hypothetical protein n=1 Tax=Leishmania sp. Namibia TaxID=2802991 RepID=UPI001B618714|nr:hypothetical protein JIQ42_05007 [Leishmania sp. Namibia]
MEAQQQQYYCEALAADGAADGDKQGGLRRVDGDGLHPSVRFYRGMWSLTQLSDPIFDDVPSNTDGSNGDKTASAQAPATLPAVPSGSHSPPPRSSRLSIVGLHQALLPPAAVSGAADVAEENYAVQLASSDGLELLRLHWHVLLPLLFPCCRWGDQASANAPGVLCSVRNSCSGAAEENGPSSFPEQQGCSVTEDGPSAPAESAWSATDLYELLLHRPLMENDLATIREPGLMDRVYYSYVVLLRFFGWRVHEEERGLLDRHRGWQERYALLELYRTSAAVTLTAGGETGTTTAASLSRADHGSVTKGGARPPPPPTYRAFNFYESGVPRVLRCLLDIGFLRLAVRLVEFLLEEMGNGRLRFLLPLVETTLLPTVVQHSNVESSHKARLRKRLYRLTHSDSD